MHRLLLLNALVIALLAPAVPVYAEEAASAASAKVQPAAHAGESAAREAHRTATATSTPVLNDKSTARAEVVDGAVPAPPASLSRDDWKFNTTPYPPGAGLAGHMQI